MPFPHHNEQCKIQYKYNQIDSDGRKIIAFFCDTHNQWIYSFGKPVAWDFSKEDEWFKNQIRPHLGVGDLS